VVLVWAKGRTREDILEFTQIAGAQVAPPAAGDPIDPHR
jgi:hypothetical protein